MSKSICSIILILILSLYVNSKESWQCDSKGDYTCLSNQTCCRNKNAESGWKCFNLKNAQCCSDGLSACPENYICNMRELKCDSRPGN